jgi:hypothetical protein
MRVETGDCPDKGSVHRPAWPCHVMEASCELSGSRCLAQTEAILPVDIAGMELSRLPHD